MNARTGRLAAVVSIAALALAGCSTGPSPEEIMTSNTEARAEIQRLVDEAVEVVLAATADLEPEEVTGGVHESWSACSDAPYGPSDPPESVTWRYYRSFRTPPEADTLARVADLAAVFVERGWTTRQGTVNDFQRIEVFGNDDGYVLEVTGQLADGDEPPYLYVEVLSPCVPTPPDLEW